MYSSLFDIGGFINWVRVGKVVDGHYIPLGMCSKQVFRTSSSVTAERGFGDDSTEKKQ